MIGQFRKHMGEPCLRIDVVELASFNQRIDASGSLRAFVRARESPIATSDGDATILAFCRIIRKADASVVEEAGERFPTDEAIIDCSRRMAKRSSAAFR